MNIELDHVFVCTSKGAPEAAPLVHLGFIEGTPNVHPGQGTANRRFSFRNAMLELLWVSDSTEAMNEATRNTYLWERWSKRALDASPFGICTRPQKAGTKGSPFAAWEYKPAYLPAGLCMHIGKAPIEEPMWVHLDFVEREHRVQHFVEHPNGATEITGLRLTTPSILRSDPARVVLQNRIVILSGGHENLLEIELDRHRSNKTLDLRPALPILFHL